MDHRIHHLSQREKLKCLGLSVLFTVVIAYLFYSSWFGLLLFPVLFAFLIKKEKRAGVERVQAQLAKEFIDALHTISAALLAGLSMENAWKEAEGEMLALYGENSYLYRELAEMNHSIALNIPIEQLLTDFADRSGNGDIASFAEVFAFAKRSGGNFVTIMEGTVGNMRARYETEREIQVQVASRKMEQKVMNVIPLFIHAYLKLTSMDFLDVLYGNAAGILFMTVCLLAYGMAMILADRILKIRV